jgi:hypothetical protein
VVAARLKAILVSAWQWSFGLRLSLVVLEASFDLRHSRQPFSVV